MTRPGGRRAVFLDRDGVLNVYLPGDYVTRPESLVLLPGTGDAVRRLNDAGWVVAVITNQQGVAKGRMTRTDLDAVHAALRDGIARDGGQIDGLYCCPHLAAENCPCRKPRPGLIEQAAADRDIDLARSWFVGDTEGDSGAARAGGVGRFCLVLTGKRRREDADDRTLFPTPPDHVADDLSAAVAHILAENERP